MYISWDVDICDAMTWTYVSHHWSFVLGIQRWSTQGASNTKCCFVTLDRQLKNSHVTGKCRYDVILVQFWWRSTGVLWCYAVTHIIQFFPRVNICVTLSFRVASCVIDATAALVPHWLNIWSLANGNTCWRQVMETFSHPWLFVLIIAG